MKISIPIHTVVTLVGCNYTGKSLLCNKLVERLKTQYPELNFHIISSDVIRRELIGENLPRSSDEMLYASSIAFEVLFFKLRALLSFPLSIKNAVVFIDTTGLNKEFRERINKIATEYHYNTAALVLDYKEYDDYYYLLDTFPNESVDRKAISKHIKRLRCTALPEITKKQYPHGKFIIKTLSKEWEDINISLSNYSEYLSCWLPYASEEGDIYEYTILSDINGCYEELIESLTQVGFSIENNRILNSSSKRVICLSNYFNKENLNSNLLDFLYLNKDCIYFCKSNQELPDSLIEELSSVSKPFFIHPNFICSSSPCKFSKLGKLDKESIKAQIKYNYPSGDEYESIEDYKKALEKHLGFIKHQGNSNNFPFIFSGNIPLKNYVRLGSQVLLNTSVINGNKLTTCTIKHKYLEFNSVNARDTYIPICCLVNVFDEKEPINLSGLDSKEYKRLTKCLGTKPTLWLAPTMSPSSSNKNTLEPLDTAIDYYLGKDVTELVMQPKYMGSNAVLIWKPDINECYMTSRNGHLIHSIDLSPIYNYFYPLISKAYPNASLVVLSGELLPWTVLGKELIDEHFIPIYIGMKEELEFCKDNQFNKVFSALLESSKKEFSNDRKNLSKNELKSKYGNARIEWYNSVQQHYKYIRPVDIELIELEKYKRELDGYIEEGDIHFKPFQLLKVEENEKVSVLPLNNYDGFKLFNSDPIIKIDIKDISKTKEYLNWVFNTWITNSLDLFRYSKLEGVVIKPLDCNLKGIAPSIKVRNEQYLKLVYGPTYNLEPTHSKLVKTKDIRGKIRSSIKEWELGKELLNIPSNQLNINNSKALNLVSQFIAEEKKVSVMDPRL